MRRLSVLRNDRARASYGNSMSSAEADALVTRRLTAGL